MIEYLINKTIKADAELKSPEVRNKAIRTSGIIGVGINVFLFILKLVIGIFINSVAVISDAFNNLADSLSSIVTLLGATLSNKPADKEHPFGHGRYEYIASLIISFLIILTGLSLFKTSISKIFKPEEINVSNIAIIILFLSIFFKVFMYRYNKILGEKTGSLVPIGVAKDSINDVIASLGIILSILVYRFANINIDGYAGVILSIIIFKSGIEIAQDSIKVILGEAPSDELISDIKIIIMKHKDVKGMHSLDIHDYGNNKIVGSVHLEFPCHMIFQDVHNVADSIEKEIRGKCGVEIVVHMDPVDCKRGKNEDGSFKDKK